ncbi:hypothetical protein GGF43_000480 [Coemansia sp. RSA 2618]|nr:hypothetical protein GGF43_000480 [Coemansia sp. RSA 2618]
MPNILLSQVCKEAAKRQAKNPREPSEFSASPKSSFFDYYNTYNHDTLYSGNTGTLPNANTLVGRDYTSDVNSSVSNKIYVPPPLPNVDLKPNSFVNAQARMDEEMSMRHADAELYAQNRNHGGPPVGKFTRWFVKGMRIGHTLDGLIMMVCFGAMEAYMLKEQFTPVAIPLTVCRLILVIALLVLILCDWAVPKRIHRYFPMYSFQHSFKALGISQIVIAFFAFGDSTVAKMSGERDESKFARVLFPYKGQTTSIPTDSLTLGQLRKHIEQQFDIPAANQKLICKGLLRDDDAKLSDLVAAGSKVVLMGTPAAELTSFQEHCARRQLGRANNLKYQASSANVYQTRTSTVDEHGFASFETLNISHRRADALQMLRRLAHDEGVRQVMRKHKYSVGVLRELHPNERTILGYNRNRGQVIALRLRTDDLEGFRDYLAVRRVLMHELAHMVWDEHDENFHRLNSEHCKEVVGLDWTLRGRTVGPQAEYYEPQPSDAEDVDGGSLKATGFVLGGSMPALDDADDRDARRERAYSAFMKRSAK